MIMIPKDKQEALQVDASSLQSREDVAKALYIQDKTLRYILFGIRPENMYQSFEIPKKSGKVRRINAPNGQLKAIQRTLAKILTSMYIKRHAVYGFVQGCNHITNAKVHVHSRCLLNIDLQDYFTQFHFGRVVGTLTHPPYSMGMEAAKTVAQICCLNGTLPQGAPTSPILSNIISAPLDSALTRLAKKYRLMYTRYADDITLSSHEKKFPSELAHLEEKGVQLGDELLEIFYKNNFKINREKITLHYSYRRQEVTGIVINKKINLKREYLKNMRSILHHCTVDGVYQTAVAYAKTDYCHSKKLKALLNGDGNEADVEKLFRRILWGKLNYIRAVRGRNDMLFYVLAEQYNKIFQSPEFEEETVGCPREQIRKTVILEFQDSMGNVLSQGSGFYLEGLGLLTCQHVIDGVRYASVQVRNLYDFTEIGNYRMDEKSLCDENKQKDYALFLSEHTQQIPYSYKIGDSFSISVGQPVWLISYPEYISSHTSAQVLYAKVAQKKTKFGIPFYTVDQRITHGSSGGAVLNTRFEVIGMIRGGSTGDVDINHESESGFTPLHIILENCDLT